MAAEGERLEGVRKLLLANYSQEAWHSTAERMVEGMFCCLRRMHSLLHIQIRVSIEVPACGTGRIGQKSKDRTAQKSEVGI